MRFKCPPLLTFLRRCKELAIQYREMAADQPIGKKLFAYLAGNGFVLIFDRDANRGAGVWQYFIVQPNRSLSRVRAYRLEGQSGKIMRSLTRFSAPAMGFAGQALHDVTNVKCTADNESWPSPRCSRRLESMSSAPADCYAETPFGRLGHR
jgi:hypothetical protein